jgi:cathepsin D
MHFSLATILAIVPLVLSAANTTQTPHVTIPLKRHGSFYRSDGSVDLEALKWNADYTTAYVIPPFNLRMPSDSSYSKRLQGFINYERNTGTPHPRSLGIENFKRDVVNLPLQEIQNPLMWMGSISVGIPPVQFNVEIDVGIGNFFLAHIGCETCRAHTFYDPIVSPTAHSLNRIFNIGASVTGQLWTDTVRIFGLTATQQTVGAASVWHNPRETREDGVMGMAFRSVGTYNAAPVFETLVRQHQTDSPVFAMKLVENEAMLTLGGLNTDLYHGPIIWVDVTGDGYWEIESESLRVGGQNIVAEFSCIIDTARSN